MFPLIEIAFTKDNIVFSTDGEEFEILDDEDATCLINYQLLKQLKISVLKVGYCIIDNRCVYLKRKRPLFGANR